MCKGFLYILLALGAAYCANTQNCRVLSMDSFQGKDNVVTLEKGWRYHPGDNPLWASKNYQDSAWEQVENTALYLKNMPNAPWEGIGWFRYTFKIDSTLSKKMLSLLVAQSSASDIFIDGRYIYSIGKVGVSKEEEQNVVTWGNKFIIPFSVDSEGEHILAIRYSNFCVFEKKRFEWPTGFAISLGEWKRSYSNHGKALKSSTSFWMFFTGVPLAFAVLHFFLFIFYPAARGNLFYSLFTISAAALTFTVLRPLVDTEFSHFMVRFYFFKLSVLSMMFFSLLFLYTVFYPKIPKQFRLILSISIIIAVITHLIPLSVIYFWGILITVEQLRVVIISVIKKKEGAFLIGFGYLLFGITGTYQMLMGMSLVPQLEGAMQNPYLWGVLSVLIVMSIYLARNSALTNKRLGEVTKDQKNTIDQLKIEMTERKRAEEMARQQQEKLIQAEKMATLGILVSGIAHEINNPNNFMLLNSNNLADIWKDLKPILDTYNEEKSELIIAGIPYNELREDIGMLINGISEGSERIEKIVANLKDYARKDPGNMDQDIDVNNIIDAARTILANLIKKSTDNFHVTCQDTLPKVKGNAQQIEQVIINLISNSCQSLVDRGKSITVTTTFDENANQIIITVQDEGKGIAKKDLKHIMDPFFTTKRDFGGTGLGLSISQKIIKDHGGDLNYESEIEKGTSAIVSLPAVS